MRAMDVSCLAARLARAILVATLLAAVAAPPARAVAKQVGRDLRDTYEGRTMRLRVDLRSAAHAVEPNVMTLEGIGYGRESSQVMFGQMERVYLERITSDGARRLALTIYRSEEEMKRLRGAIPPPVMGIPGPISGHTGFAMADSTTVMLDLTADKKDPDGQRREAEILMQRLFYVSGEPPREDLERYIVEHRTLSVGRLASATGLTQDEVRRILEANAP